MNETQIKIDQLKTIIEKFLAWNPDCKDWSFEEVNGVVEITLPILDAHNDYVQLYASIHQPNSNIVMFEITDDGFIAEEYDYKGKTSIFISPLKYCCHLEDFNESMDYYFDALRCAGIPIGFTKLLDRQAIEKIDNEYSELEKIFKKSPIKSYLGKKTKMYPDPMGNPIDYKEIKKHIDEQEKILSQSKKP